LNEEGARLLKILTVMNAECEGAIGLYLLIYRFEGAEGAEGAEGVAF